MSLCEFVAYAATTGMSVVAGTLLSYIVEYIEGWGRLTPRAKRLVFGVLCLFIGGAGYGLSYILCPAPLDWWAVLVAVWSSFAAFGSGTIAHTRKL